MATSTSCFNKYGSKDLPDIKIVDTTIACIRYTNVMINDCSAYVDTFDICKNDHCLDSIKNNLNHYVDSFLFLHWGKPYYKVIPSMQEKGILMSNVYSSMNRDKSFFRNSEKLLDFMLSVTKGAKYRNQELILKAKFNNSPRVHPLCYNKTVDSIIIERYANFLGKNRAQRITLHPDNSQAIENAYYLSNYNIINAIMQSNPSAIYYIYFRTDDCSYDVIYEFKLTVQENGQIDASSNIINSYVFF